MLFRELAEAIVNETMKQIEANVNLMDRSGMIVASGDRSRIGQRHSAAAMAAASNRTYIVEEDDPSRGLQRGVNVPIELDGVVIGAVGVSGDPGQLLTIAKLVKMTAELMVKQSRVTLQEEWRQMTADLILEHLSHPNKVGFEQVQEWLNAIAFQLEPPFRIVALEVNRRGKAAQWMKASDVIRRIEGIVSGRKFLIGRDRPDRLIILLAKETGEGLPYVLDRLVTLFAKDDLHIAIGVSDSAAKREELPEASIEALEALRMCVLGAETVVDYKKVEAEALITQLPVKYAERLLGKWDSIWTEKLEETLSALFECGLNAYEAASKLGIHRNTMTYRLGAFTKATGYDPHRFQDAIVLQSVIWLRRRKERVESSI